MFVAIALWVVVTLAAFLLLRPTYELIVTVLLTPLSVGSISISLGDILAFALAIWVATLATRFTKFILEQDVFPHLSLPRGVPGAITKVLSYVIMGLGIVVAVAAAGIDLSSIALLAGALGVGIGFGLQNIVSNFVSGLILIFERPIQVGDSVQLDTLKGTVKNIGIRASTVRTFEGAEVLLPNADLLAGHLVNWTLSDRLRRLDILVGVAYGTDPHQTKEILLEVAKAIPDCLKSPVPYVLFQGFGDSSLDFELRFWTSNFDNWLTIKSDATFDVHDALQKAGIEIPFPQRDLHVRSVDSSVSGAITDVQPVRREDQPRHDTETTSGP
jgi:small-conductance mechanosensitive channel